MSKSMRNDMLDAVKVSCQGQLQLHKTNIEIYLNKSIGIGEHSDIIETMIKEIEQVAKWEEILMAIDNNFPYEDPARQTILNENK